MQECQNIKLIKYFNTGFVGLSYRYTSRPFNKLWDGLK